MSEKLYVKEIDCGSDSVSSVIPGIKYDQKIASFDFTYSRWNNGLSYYQPQNQFRQHPVDYVEIPEASLKDYVQ